MATHRDLFDPTDPAKLQPEQCLTQVAAILAAGVIRMREKRKAAPAPIVRTRPGRSRGAASSSRRRIACMSPIPPDSRETRLEFSRLSSPDGQCG
jgi:hypothetical protein